MSPIGRIFIVLNLILAAVFLAWAANNVAQSHDYRTKLNAEIKAHGETKATLDGQVSQLRTDLDTKSAEADSFRSERDDARADAARNGSQADDLRRQVSDANAANEKNSTALTDIRSTLDSINTSKDEAVAAQRKAENERDDALASAQDANSRSEDLEAENADLQNTISELEGKVAMLQTKVGNLDTQLATLVDVTGVNYRDIAGQQQIEADVLQAVYDVKPGLIALNKGSKDGVKRGYTFEIFNGRDYKGQARVENVREDMCTALILRVEDGQTIKSGDKASTRL
jgi:predicted  nucleic acid-binding Zn-ribbon protein